jgi:hypothetical protein
MPLGQELLPPELPPPEVGPCGVWHIGSVEPGGQFERWGTAEWAEESARAGTALVAAAAIARRPRIRSHRVNFGTARFQASRVTHNRSVAATSQVFTKLDCIAIGQRIVFL